MKQSNKPLVAASKERTAHLLRTVGINNFALTSLVIVILAVTSPLLLFLSYRQDFFDRTFNLSPFKVFYFFSVGVLILISWGFSRKSPRIGKKYLQILFPIIPILGVFLLFSSDWSVFLYSQPDRIRTYTSVTTYFLAGFLTLLILNKTRILGLLLNSLAILILIYLSSFLVLNDFHPYNANSLNLSIVFHPIIQSTLGIGLQSELRAQYGMYGEILSPFISLGNRIFGLETSITQVSAILALLFFFSYLSVYLFLKHHLSNKKLLAISFMGFLYLSLFAVTTWPAELYYQYYPIRLFFPMTSLLLVVAMGKITSKKFRVATFIYLALGIFWNLDVGLFTLLSSLVYYHVLFALKYQTKEQRISNFKELLLPLITITGTIVAFNLAHILRFGEGISTELFFASQKLFLSGQIPPINGVWRFVFLIYISSLAFSIISLRQKHDVEFQAQMLYLSLLGLGLFLYFINNPHPSVLSNTYWPVCIIIFIYLDRFARSTRTWKFKFNYSHLCSALLIFPVAWSGSVSIVNLKNSQIMKDQVNFAELFNPESLSNRALWAQPASEVTPETRVSSVSYVTVENHNLNPQVKPGWVLKSEVVKNFFEKITLQDKTVAVFSMWDHKIYMDLGVGTPFSAPNFYHTYLPREWGEIYQNLRNPNGVNYVVVDEQFGLWRGESLAHPIEYINRIQQILDHSFTLVESKSVGYSWYLDHWMPNGISIYIRK